MALNKTNVQIPVESGLDTKIDPKQQSLGTLRVAENIVYETDKLIRKRNGYDNVAIEDILGNTIQDVQVLTKFKEELIALTKTGLHSYSGVYEKFVEKGSIYATSVDTRKVVKNSNEQTKAFSVTTNNFDVYAWKDSSGGVRYSVQDRLNNNFIVADDLVSAAGDNPKIAVSNNYVYIFYNIGNVIYFKKFFILEPKTLTAESELQADLDITYFLFDVAYGQDKIFIAYQSNDAGQNLKLFSLDSNDNITSTINFAGEEATGCINLIIDTQFRVHLLWADATDVKTSIYPFNLGASLLSPTSIEVIANVVNVTAAQDGSDYRVFYEVSQTNNIDHYVKKATITLAGVVTNISVLCRSVGLASDAFVQNDIIYVNTVYGSDEQSTYFVMDENGIVLTKTNSQNASGLIDYGILRPVSRIDDDNIQLTNQERGKVDASNGTFLGLSGITSSQINFAPNNVFQNAYLADNLHIAAGVLKMYDGESIVEHGFHVYPEGLEEQASAYPITATVTQLNAGGVAPNNQIQYISFSDVPTTGSFTLTINAQTTAAILFSDNAAAVETKIEALASITDVTVVGDYQTGFTIYFITPNTANTLATVGSNTLEKTTGNMSDGDYGYVAVYRWTDVAGQEHVSAPNSIPLSVTLSGGGSTQQAVVRVPTLRITEKENVIIDLYRTEADGTIYYKVTSVTNPVMNDKTIDYIDIVDSLSDADLIFRESLYTNGGVLENISAPACSLVTVFNNRLAVVGEETNTVYFSKLVETGKPVEFTDLIAVYFDPYGGDVTAINAMDDKFVAHQEDAVMYMSGDGPTNTLEQDTFTAPELISSDIGCLDPDSVILTPVGLMFKSRKGIWLLTKSLDLAYVGDKVEGFNSSTITAVDIIGELNQIRFVTSESIALVYNYNLNRWAVFTNHGGRSSVVIGNDYYYLREDNTIYKENRTSFSDASSPIKMRMEIGWISLNQLQGYQRVYHAMILGTFKSAHKLKVKVAYNYVEAYVQEDTINVLDFIDPTAYGDYSPYGDPSSVNYGGNLDGNLYQMRIDLERQKCQAIKILIEDAQDTVGEGLSFSSLQLRVGAKDGEFKLPATNKYGVQ